MTDVEHAHSQPSAEEARQRLVGGGEMARMISGKDWSATSLGPITEWSSSLRGSIALCTASPFPLCVAWGPQHLQLYNDGYAHLCGDKHPGALGQSFRECWEFGWPTLGDAFERALAGEASYHQDQRTFVERSGRLEEVFLTFSFSPIRDDAGAVSGVLHAATETTGKTLAERRAQLLREVASAALSARSVDEVFELSAQALAGASLDVPFARFYAVDASRTEVRLITGAPQGSLGLGAPLRVALNVHSSAVALVIAEVLRSNRPRSIDDLEAYFGALPQGPYAESPQSAFVLPITPPGFESPFAVLVAATSPRLALTEDYRTFYQLLADSVAASIANALTHEEQRRRIEQLVELDRAKTGFFSDVTHEFRTPLTLLVGPLEDELAETVNTLPAARRERVAVAHRSALRLLKLVNMLLDLSRVESGRLLANYRPTDLSTLTSELVSMFRSAFERAGLTLVLTLEPLPEPIYVDHEMWEKIVLNLMSNAFKHTFQGSIRVTLRALPGSVEFEVADTGIGIAESDLPHLFERFQRVKGARSRTAEGTGIGLALVRELSRLHGGEVRVASRLGHGAVFTVSLPRGKAHLPAANVGAEASTSRGGAGVAAYVQEALQWSLPAGPTESSAEGSTPPEPDYSDRARTRKPLILVADDNADMRDYIERLLGNAYRVVCVADGAEALRVATKRHPDLVLSDVMMPGLDGFEFLRALRADARTQPVPVILLSARAGEDSAVEGLEAGADDYLVKPFSARELRARVRTHLDLARVRRQWAEHLEHANQELEAFSYSVSHDLRTPLRAIDGFSKAILSQKAHLLDEQGKSYLARVRAATARMSDLIDELLNLSRVSRVPLHRQSVDLSRTVRVVVGDLQEQYPMRHVDFSVEDDLLAQVDPRLVKIVFENLLGNSWKFSSRRSDPQVHVGQLPDCDPPTYFVRDNGVGFDQTYAHRLFQPFQRLHADGDFRGSGVGLAIVHRIVTRHGGSVWAESRENHGATFYFTLSEKT
ncbi:MAG: ATP-binding protein [Polyangiaceae bacterium]